MHTEYKAEKIREKKMREKKSIIFRYETGSESIMNVVLNSAVVAIVCERVWKESINEWMNTTGTWIESVMNPITSEHSVGPNLFVRIHISISVSIASIWLWSPILFNLFSIYRCALLFYL